METLTFLDCFKGMDRVTLKGLISRRRLDTVSLLIASGVLIRLVFLGLMDLFPEEAYYWNYSRHLDIGYLDHPPMIAWLIRASQSLVGRSEFAVRFPAFVGWFVMAFFMYKLTVELVGRKAGRVVVLLLAVFPIYMSVGFMMTPDAPMYAAWAAGLYFLARALLTGRSSAWFGVGVSLGLGLFSKYTMGLLIPATLAFVLVDHPSRSWLRRPQPYLAVVIAAVIFAPVVYWNYLHHWISFAFQGTRRWSGVEHFSLHVLIASILVLLTPIGFYAAWRALLICWRKSVRAAERTMESRRHLFMLVFTLVPLTVFIVHSLQGEPKLNWTGPVWLSVLPMIAVVLGRFSMAEEAATVRLPRLVSLTASILLVLYAGASAYVIAGTPGLSLGSGMKLPIAWHAMGRRVDEIESNVQRDTGSEPLIVGLDKYWIASQLSFYDEDDDERPDFPESGASGLFGENSLMWNYWTTPQTARSRNALLISFSERDLEKPQVTNHFSSVGNIFTEVLRRGRCNEARFYWRPAYGYRD